MHFSDAPRLTPPAPVKRPRVYNDEVGYTILERIGNGQKLHTICQDEAMPSPATVYRWISESPGFAEAYRCAVEARFDKLEEELIQIADDAANDYVLVEDKDGIPTVKPNTELMARTAVRLEIRKWIMAKGLPRKYGDPVPQAPAPKVASEVQAVAPKELEPVFLARSEATALLAARTDLQSR